jgi:hypothetical protein
MSADRCDICCLVHPERRCYYDDLIEALQGLPISPAEHRTLRWLAGCEFQTVEAIATLFRRFHALLKEARGPVAKAQPESEQ